LGQRIEARNKYKTDKCDQSCRVSKLEEGKRKGAKLVFGDKIMREVRRGGRMMLLADILEPNIPGRGVTVVATHLEAKAKPSERVKQLVERMKVHVPKTGNQKLAGRVHHLRVFGNTDAFCFTDRDDSFSTDYSPSCLV